MTSVKQIQANRRNALKSTGPSTTEGKQRSRLNAVRHGLTAETVIGALEDAEDYKAFEAAIIADFDAQSAVERELLLRLASLLWRLRRATTIETGLFDKQAEQLQEFRYSRQVQTESRKSLYALFGPNECLDLDASRASVDAKTGRDASSAVDRGADLANCFLRLANLPNYALDRLSRYEAILWRQVAQILFSLNVLNRRTPQERRRNFDFHERQNLFFNKDAR